MNLPAEKRSKRQTSSTNKQNQEADLKECSLCDDINDKTIVQNPREASYCELAHCVTLNQTYRNTTYMNLDENIKNPEWLMKQNAKWHRKCYKDATCSDKLKRAKNRYEKMEKGVYAPVKKGRPKQIPITSESEISFQHDDESSNVRFLRNCTCPYDKTLCFFVKK